MLSKKIDIYFASVPGRGIRFIEEPLQDIAYVVSHMNKEIKPLLGQYNFFFGHSLTARYVVNIRAGWPVVKTLDPSAHRTAFGGP
jgi:surfactin synthase thioesterase subunit